MPAPAPRWRAAVAPRVAARPTRPPAWRDSRPPRRDQSESATAEAWRALCDRALSALAAGAPPRGSGRD